MRKLNKKQFFNYWLWLLAMDSFQNHGKTILCENGFIMIKVMSPPLIMTLTMTLIMTLIMTFIMTLIVMKMKKAYEKAYEKAYAKAYETGV